MAHSQQSSSELRASHRLLRLAWTTQTVRCNIAQSIRTTVCGPACTVVWEGWSREAPPYPDSYFDRRRDTHTLIFLVDNIFAPLTYLVPSRGNSQKSPITFRQVAPPIPPNDEPLAWDSLGPCLPGLS